MEPTDLTVHLLQEIRDAVRENTGRLDSVDHRLERMDERFEQMDKRFEQMGKRFEVIETTLRDLAQQMVMLSHGIKTALEGRAEFGNKLDDHEKRLSEIEKRLGH